MSVSHATRSAAFIADETRTDWHDDTLWLVRNKRDIAAQALPEWEALRQAASDIKDHTLLHLHDYLLQFERNAQENGVIIHWANSALDHNQVILSILKKAGIGKLLKSKSMLTEECHLNSFLQKNGITVIDTDLGERIVQLRKEAPSHIVLPAIHLKKEDVSDTFHEHLQSEKGNADPLYLTQCARAHLREHFATAEAALTGVNFAVAETGTIVVCTNEGNADLGVHSAKVHIAAMGIEKVIPRAKDLAVFLRLLARSATGQPVTTYTSHFNRPQDGRELHVIIVNNYRTRQLANPDFRNSLKCIRCAACFNTCPVYRRSGGHSYNAVIAGPIGSVLSPAIDKKEHADLPFASTLCGSCSNVCPVKIDLHVQLWKWRQTLMKEGRGSLFKKWIMKSMSMVLGHPVLYRVAGKSGRWVLRRLPILTNNKYANPWFRQRDLPKAPKQSFRDWYIKNRI